LLMAFSRDLRNQDTFLAARLLVVEIMNA
jgi:hypothetical protein